MKAQELRLGNLIEYKIKDELDERKEWWAANKLDILDLTWLYSNPEDTNFRPIKLTEEWLLKFGFKKDKNGIFYIDLFTHYLELMYSMECYYPVYIQKSAMSSENEQRIGLINLEFVHELQNLYFVLTGEELTQVSEGEK